MLLSDKHPHLDNTPNSRCNVYYDIEMVIEKPKQIKAKLSYREERSRSKEERQLRQKANPTKEQKREEKRVERQLRQQDDPTYRQKLEEKRHERQ